MSFEQLAIAAPILKALAEQGYSEPTPIQEQSIPVILQQKDVLGCARTGTGKTAAFAIPVIQLLAAEKAAQPTKGIRALVLTPTRELALQIQESFEAYGKHTGIRQVVIFGGVSQQAQVSELRRGTDVLVATPGRLIDLMQQGIINIGNIKILVLDEADRMLDMGFIHDVKKVIAKTPAQKQTLFFSATMAPEIRKLADTILRNPVAVQVTPVASTAETVEQSLYFVDKKNKNPLLVHILQDENIKASIVFSRTKHGANKIAKALENAGIRAEAIHGNKSQSARQRALQLLKEREIRVLVATDIAARGIDVDELSHVINYDLPNVPETYVHRIGRTGRAGASGLAISFCDHEEKEFLRDIQKLIKKSVPVVEDHPFKFGSPIAKETVSHAPALTRNQPGSKDIRNKHGKQQQKGRQQGNSSQQGARPLQQRQHNQQKQNQSRFQQPDQQPRRPQHVNHQQMPADDGPKTWQELLDAENEMMNQASGKWSKSSGQKNGQQKNRQQSSQKNAASANRPFQQQQKNSNGFRGNNSSRNNHNG